jgi:hypothetical protein
MLFNNCHSRPHADLFGPTAFYDLMTSGKQAAMATDLQPGQHCCVATPTENGDIEFGWFCFSHERCMRDPNDPNTTVRVFFGDWLGSETLPRAGAIEAESYTHFFNVNGHFKRPSAIPPTGQCVAPAGLVRG